MATRVLAGICAGSGSPKEARSHAGSPTVPAAAIREAAAVAVADVVHVVPDGRVGRLGEDDVVGDGGEDVFVGFGDVVNDGLGVADAVGVRLVVDGRGAVGRADVAVRVGLGVARGFTASRVGLEVGEVPAARAGSDFADRPEAVGLGLTDGDSSGVVGVGLGEAECSLDTVTDFVARYPLVKPRGIAIISAITAFLRLDHGWWRCPMCIPPFDAEKPPPKWGF
jgi:hypothetical protein